MAKKDNTIECAIKVGTLTQNYNVSQSNYTKIFRKMVLLDAVDRSRLWQALRAKFPSYQILPDTNWVNYVKSNLLASIYTVAKGATLLPTSDSDREAVENINIALGYIWDTANVAYYQTQAGSSAALFNLGITQVGWDAEPSGGTGDTFYKGELRLKNINPLRFMRDPFAENLESAAYCMTWSDEHETVLMANPKYRERFRSFKAESAVSAAIADPVVTYPDAPEPNGQDGYYKLVIHFVRYNDEQGDGKIAEVHTLNNDYVLWFNNDIKPNRFPFVELYCNLPEGDVVGTSEPARILSNNIAYNIMNSMMLTAEYKNQRPPRFISSGSGLNIQSFSKYGNDADRVFVVNGDASKAVHYHQFPVASASGQALQGGLMNDMQTTSGVDGRYTGRDTGSVITTGGIEDMLNRVTMIDTPKITNYEKYTKELTQLILMNFVEFSLKRTYFQKDPASGKYKKVVVNYETLSNEALYHYAINISSELPKTKQRIAAAATALMEKQMQYGASGNGPELITAEEWLQYQDLPFKEAMLKRMGIQRVGDATAQFAEGLFDYAALVKQGVRPDDAVAAVGENIAAGQGGQERPNEIPPLDTLMQEEQPQMPPEQSPAQYAPPADPAAMMNAVGSDLQNAQNQQTELPDINTLLAMLGNPQ